MLRLSALLQLSVIVAVGSLAAGKAEAGKTYKQLVTVTATIEAIALSVEKAKAK